MKKIIAITLFLLISLMPLAAFCSEQATASMYLWRMINDARVHPLETLQEQGIDAEVARAALGDDAWMIDQGLPPLAWNDALFQAAAGHNQEMVAQLYYGSTGLDGSSVADRIAARDYEAQASDELLGAMAFSGFMEPLEAAKLTFVSWLMDELNPAYGGARRIFSREFTEMGISFNAAVLDLGLDVPHNVYVVVADFAMPLVPRVYLIGNIYEDVNGDGQWELGEGKEGVEVLVRDVARGESQRWTSGFLGAYQIAVADFYFTITVLDSQGQPALSMPFNGISLGRTSNSMVDLCPGW
jgi:hypothetical protein